MKLNYLKVMAAVAAVVLFISIPVSAQQTPGVSRVSGEIASIDVKLGKLQLRSSAPEGAQEVREYRISQYETRVTDPTDKKFFVIKDLRAGQFITMEVIKSEDNERQLFVQKIIADPKSMSYFQEAADANAQAQAPAQVADGRAHPDASLVGPRGLTGPAGTAGVQGLTGAQGAPGVALRGERGEQGAAGPAGERGLTGSRGPEGDLARGPAGEVGAKGPSGMQGEVGKQGEQGTSSAGYAGPRGATGPRGEQGPVGDAGAKGITTYGPAGPSGYAGAAGNQGIVGKAGSQGGTTAGVAGSAGSSGAQGAMGAKGTTGDRGLAGQVDQWVLYKEFNFPSNVSSLNNDDMRMIKEITGYLNKNQSLQLGIDGTAVKSRDQGLNNRRVSAIRSALIKAGVSPNKISMGEIGNEDRRQEGRIAVFFTTTQFDDSLSKN